MNTSNTNIEPIPYAAVKAQTLQDFKNSVFIVSLTVNFSLLFAWALLNAAYGSL